MAKQLRNPPSGFDSDLDAILNRVYGSSTNSDLDRKSSGIPASFVRHEQDSNELKQALAELRGWREKSQSTMRMKEEMRYLQDQIRQLKELRHQIDSLRQKLEAEPEPS